MPVNESPIYADADVYTNDTTVGLVELALYEDLAHLGDLTVTALVPETARLRAHLTAKSCGVVCGLPLFAQVCSQVAKRFDWGPVSMRKVLMDGTRVTSGELTLEAEGDARTILVAERTALNLIQRLSGTATLTRAYVDAIAGTHARIFDTRKTSPAMRALQKQAVVAGGGARHREGLYDQVLIKENHIALMLGPNQAAAAVRRCRDVHGADATIEVEIETLDDLGPVMDAGADIVLLDNMPTHDLAEAVRRRGERDNTTVHLEASGGITLETVGPVAATGVDRISAGALTHSVAALDLSLRLRSPV